MRRFRTIVSSQRFECRRRSFASSAETRSSRAHLVFGANTDIGKTVLTAALIRASCCDKDNHHRVHYIKPLQCGGSDEAFVVKHAPGLYSSKTLFDWETPASPHIAARIENKPVHDDSVLKALTDHLDQLEADQNTHSVWVETAGGVLSPSSSSPYNRSPHHAVNEQGWGWITQADLYQGFRDRLPVVLIGDGRLGGISATLASLEAVLHREYKVKGILLLGEDNDTNYEALQEYVRSTGLFSDPEKAIVLLPSLPPEPEPLNEWYDSDVVRDTMASFVHEYLFR